MACSLLLATKSARAAPSEPGLEEKRVRRVTLAAAVGFNSIVPLGILVGYNVHSNVAVDVGLGYSLFAGWRVGARLRYRFLRETVSPFFGVGTYYNPFFESLGSLPAPGGGGNTSYYHPGLFVVPMVGAVVQESKGIFVLAGVGGYFRVSGVPDERVLGDSLRDRIVEHLAFEVAGGFSF